MLNYLFIFANAKVRDVTTAGIKEGSIDLFLGPAPIFTEWDSVVTRVANNVVFNSAPRPTLQQEAAKMSESEVNNVVFTVESTSIHFIPCYVLAKLVRMYQVTGSGRIIELSGRTINPQ